MALKATCPNSPEHKRFVTVAHVSEDWIVDETGTFIDRYRDGGGEVVHEPDPGNSWTCLECGAVAMVKRT